MRALRITSLILLTLASLILIAGCGKTVPLAHADIADTATSKLKVVTTFAPLYSFAKNVAGEAAEVKNLVPPGTSIHAFQAKPSDIKKIANADLLVVNGVGLETFLDDIMQSAANPRLVLVDTSKPVTILDSDDTDEQESGDPHVWLSPKNAIMQVEVIRDALIKADPNNAGAYRRNATAYIKRLNRLDSNIKKELSLTNRQKYFVFHNAYQYFERRYGLRNAGAIEESPGKEPSPRYLAKIIDFVDSRGIKIVFTEPQFSPKVVDILRQDYGIYVGVLDPVGCELSGDGYESNMRRNLASITKAFKEVKNDK